MSSTKLSAYCSRVIEAGWIAAMVLVPLYFNVYSSRVFEPDKLTLLRSIAVFMAAAWLVKTLEEVTLGHRVWHFSWRTPLVLPTLALVVIYLVSTLASVTPYTSLWGSYQRLQGTYTTWAYIVIFLLILNEMRSREQLDRLLTAVIITSVPISLYGLMQHYGIDPLPWGGNVSSRVASNMGNAIFIAAYEIMVLFVTLGRIVSSFIVILTEEDAQTSDILRASAYIFIFLVQLIAIVFSQSRGPLVGLLVGAFTFALFGLLALRRAAGEESVTRWQDVLMAMGGALVMLTGVGFVALLAYRRARKWLWLSWVLLAVLGVSFLVLFNLPDTPLEPLRELPYIGRLGKIFQTESGTGKVRVLIWKGAVKMITPHDPIGYPPDDPAQPFKTDKLNLLRPLIGYGPESMYVAYNPFYPSDLAHYERRNASPDRSHNETFDALVITGVVGLVGYMVLFGSVFYFGLKWLGWIIDKRERGAFLLLYLLGGALGAILSVLLGGPEFFGVGLPFGFTIGLVLYAIFYALFRDGVEPLAFGLFWGLVTLLSIVIVALARGGVALLGGVAVAVPVVGGLVYLMGRATYRDQARIEQDSVGAPPILLLSLLSAVIAHFVEIHFGIAIAATRTYFWVFAALLVLLGTGRLAQSPASPAPAPSSPAPTPRPSLSKRRKRRRSRRDTSVPRPQPVRRALPPWVGPVLVSSAILVLIVGTLGFDFVTNSGRITLDAGCDPAVARMLDTCWSAKAWDILKHDLTVLPPNRLQKRPTETTSYMTVGMVLITILIGGVVTMSETGRRVLFKRPREEWGWSTLLLLVVVLLLSLVVLFSIADRHLQLGRLQRDLDRSNAVALITGLLDVSMYLSAILVALYIFVFLCISVTGLLLLIGRQLPKRWATPWGAMAAPVLLVVALLIMNQTNLRVIRADIIYKQGDEWGRQKQWDIAIVHHKRALELAPNEDFYYLWAGSAYLEKAKTAPASPCILLQEPDISAVLNMPIQQTAQLCREDLLMMARAILKQARHVNPLNTDHTANLARLHKNWADLATDPTRRQQLIEQALGYYRQATRLSPQNTIIWNEMATLYLYQMGDVAQARQIISHSLELDDRFEQTYMIQGDAWVKQADDLRRQIVRKQQALAEASEEDKAALQAEIADLRDQQEQYLQAAIDAYRKALEIKPGLMNVYTTIAGALEQMGRFDEAVATFQEAIAANPKSAQPHVGLGEMYRRRNNVEAAIREYQQAVTKAPNNVNYRLVLASLLESAGRLNEALVHVQEAAQLNPNEPSVRQNLAFMYQRLQMYPEALAEAQAAAQLAPMDPTPQLLIGDISRQMNDLQGAADAYQRALVINPNLSNAWNVHLNLALIYQQLGDLNLALDHATAALNGAPENQRQQINDFIIQLQSQGAGTP